MALDIVDQAFYTHNDVESEYLEERQLGKEGKWLFFLMLGISGMISGQFFGWNVGVGEAGFWGMLISMLFVAGIYICFAFTVAELSTALPEAGGIYSFIRFAFGPFIGFLCGMLMLSFYIIMSAMIVVMVSGYLQAWVPSVPIFAWWIALYAIFVSINIAGLKWVLRVSAVLTVLALIILLGFYVGAIVTRPVINELWTNLNSLSFEIKSWLPQGSSSILVALPYALWFYLAADLIPTTAEESHNATQNLPKTIVGTILLSSFISLCTLVIVINLNSDLVVIGQEENPIRYAFSNVFGSAIPGLLLSIFALLTTFQAMIYAYGRILFSLSRAGYLPRWLSLTTSTIVNKYKIPSRSLILGAILGLICAYFINDEESIIGIILLASPLFMLIICYMFVFGSYIVLKRQRAALAGPYNSPLGVIGALVGLIGMVIVFLSYFLYAEQTVFIYGLLTIAVAAIYFGFYARKRLVAQAPLEEKALNSGVEVRKIRVTRAHFRGITYATGLILVVYGLSIYFLSPPSLPCAPNCMGMNLAGRYLENAELAGVNFIEANLRGANLAGADLQDADLSGAILTDVNLEKANLTGAKLLGVNFTRANLGGVILNETDMSGSDLIETNLTKVDLTRTKLRGVFFSNSKLVGVNLSKANLAGVTLTGANLNGANLSSANLAGALLSKADLSGAQLQKSELSGAWLNLANLIGADLSQANLDGASLIGANLASANLFESNLVGSILVGADFNGANLRSANLSGALLTKEALRQSALNDPILAQLNAIQLEVVLQDTQASGTYVNQETILPEQAAEEETLVEASPEDQATKEQNVGSIKVGVLHSLTGPLAISEIPVKDATLLAIDEINQSGGVLGKQLVPIVESGESDWQFFAEKTIKLLVEDEVVVIFGGWSGASRQAMNPILKTLDGLLFYPAQYEGQESSPNIIYTGAEPSQQLIPAIEYLLRQRYQRFFLLGSEMLFSKTAHTIMNAELTANGATVVGESFAVLGEQDFSAILEKIQASQADVVINTLSGNSNIAFFKQFNEAGLTPQQLPVMSLTMTEEEIRQVDFDPSRLAGHLAALSYFQTIPTPENEAFVKAYKTAYGSQLVTSDPIHAGYLGVYLWKAIVEQAKGTELKLIKKALANIETEDQAETPSEEENKQIEILAPGGTVRLDIESQHTYKFSRIGIIREDGLIDEIFSSNEPIKPDPFLLEYEWASDLFSREGGR